MVKRSIRKRKRVKDHLKFGSSLVVDKLIETSYKNA